jgi:hypothetical protein
MVSSIVVMNSTSVRVLVFLFIILATTVPPYVDAAPKDSDGPKTHLEFLDRTVGELRKRGLRVRRVQFNENIEGLKYSNQALSIQGHPKRWKPLYPALKWQRDFIVRAIRGLNRRGARVTSFEMIRDNDRTGLKFFNRKLEIRVNDRNHAAYKDRLEKELSFLLETIDAMGRRGFTVRSIQFVPSLGGIRFRNGSLKIGSPERDWDAHYKNLEKIRKEILRLARELGRRDMRVTSIAVEQGRAANSIQFSNGVLTIPAFSRNWPLRF